MIHGVMNEKAVYIDGARLDTTRSIGLVSHAPDGNVCWGYHGSGPSQLALALLLHFGATDEEALNWYQEFKREHIATLPETDFDMSDNVVTDWLDSRRIFAKEFENDNPV